MPQMPGEKLNRLKSMLEQVSPENTLESLRFSPRRRGGTEMAAGVGTEEAVGLEEVTAADAVEKLRQNRAGDLTPSEVHSLEAIVMPQNRPVVFVERDTYLDVESPWLHLNTPAARAIITPALPSIGRVELPNSIRIPYGGTGFIVGQDLLMTNRHVAEIFTDGLGTRLSYQPGDAAVDFKRELNTPDDDRTAYFTVEDVVMIHPFWDMALLKVRGLTSRYPALKLSVVAPEDLLDEDIVAVGYPARDDRSDLDLQDRIFGRRYNVKRLQPGKLRRRATIRSFESVVNAVTHDSSTLGGNSGSALVHVKTGQVVGLHFAGEYLKANYAVPTYELARDSRVVDAGLNFTGKVPSTDEWQSAWRRAGASEAMSKPAVAPQPGLQSPAPVTGGNTMTFQVPLTVTVSLGAPATQAAVTAASQTVAPAALTEAMKVPIIFDGLEHRGGYKDNFLRLDDDEVVPMPTLTALGNKVAAKLEDGSVELKYHKFSVVVHKGRRLALLTASNVDWREDHRLVNGKKPSRKQLTGLGDGDIEKWMTDWRIPAQHQLPDVFFTKDGGAFDKGHIVRRDDVCWGTSFQDIQKGNGDTYHTTNCTPQTGPFNQSAQGVDNWGDLENMIQKETSAEKAIIFAGPVLAEDDRMFDGKDETGSVVVRIPQRFWKIVVVKGDSGPQAFGFVLEQDLSDVPLREEFVVPAHWRRFMKSVADIEDMLFGCATLDWLKAHDRFGHEEGVRMRRHDV